MPTALARLALAACAALTLGGAAGAAHAYEITYDLIGVADGTLGSTPFSNVAFDFKAMGSSSNVGLLPSPPYEPDTYINYPVTMSVDLTGLGTYSVSGGAYIFDDNQVGLAGIGTVADGDFLYIAAPPVLQNYQLATSLPPTSGFGLLPSPVEIDTSAGVLVFNAVVDTVLSATATPEPQTWALMILGLAGVGAALRRRSALAA